MEVGKKKKKRQRERTQEGWKRRHIWGHFMPSCQLHSVMKTNNNTDQQNANLTILQKNPEVSPRKPSVENPDVLLSRALLRCSFVF